MADKTKVRPITRGKSLKRMERDASLGKSSLGTVRDWLRIDRLRFISLVTLTLVISILLFPDILIKAPLYKLGDVAKRDIKASHDFLIENREFTEKDRDKAAREALAVYDFDSAALNLVSPLKEAFELGRQYFAGLSDSSDPNRGTALAGRRLFTESENFGTIKNRFFEVLDLTPDDRLFAQLAKHGFPSQVEEATIALIAEVSESGVVADKAMLKAQIERGGIVLHEMYTKKQTTVTDSDRFYDVAGAARFIGTQAKAFYFINISPFGAEDDNRR